MVLHSEETQVADAMIKAEMSTGQDVAFGNSGSCKELRMAGEHWFHQREKTMGARVLRQGVVVILGLWIVLSQSAGAATRLGLHVSAEELAAWKSRMTDSVNKINGHSFQSIYEERIKDDADAFVAQFHPGGDGFWVGYTPAGCKDGTQQTPRPTGNPETTGFRGNGSWLLRSAFTFLLTGNNTYAHPVKTELLNQANTPGTDWANTSKWCPDESFHGATMFEIVPWIHRLLFAYDYLKAGGYVFIPSEETTIRNWFIAAGNAWGGALRTGYSLGPFYRGIYNDPPNYNCVSTPGHPCPGFNSSAVYHGGPIVTEATYYGAYNQPAAVMSFIASVGIMTNNATLLDTASKFFKAFLTVSTFDDGAVAEWVRWHDCEPGGCSTAAWSHAGGVIASLINTADVLARTGDTSLYTFKTPIKTLNGRGGTVSLHTIVGFWARLANKTVRRYGTRDSDQQNASTLLSWDTVSPEGVGGPSYWDFAMAPANLYYKDHEIETATTRQLAGDNSSRSCDDPQFAGCFSGVWTNWPDLPFMFGNMAGVVNPYSPATGPSLSLTASPASLTQGQSSTLTWSSHHVTTCTAANGWSGTQVTAGTHGVSPTATTTYTLTCTGTEGSATQSTTVTVLPPVVPQAALSIQAGDAGQVGYEAAKAIDGNLSTMWHTLWQTATPPGHPHTLEFNLGRVYDVVGLRYTPRTDAPDYGGTITQYQIATSIDNVTYTTVASGTFASDTTPKDVLFTVSAAQYVRLTSGAAMFDEPYASAAEIQIYGTANR